MESRCGPSVYDRPASDLNTIESNLTAAVAASLRAIPGIRPAQHKPKLEAMEWLMRGRHDGQAFTPEAVERMQADYRRAIEIDPADAHRVRGSRQRHNESRDSLSS
jgi:hypothetical protein